MSTPVPRLITIPISHYMIVATFERVAGILERRPYLAGDRFGAPDLTFSALTAPIVLAPGYGIPLPHPDEVDPPVRERVLTFRAHPAGAHALRCYREHRRRPVRRDR